MDGKKVKDIIQKAINDIRDKRDECDRQIAYMNNHKFNMECEAIRYKQEGFRNSWLILSDAYDEILKLED